MIVKTVIIIIISSKLGVYWGKCHSWWFELSCRSQRHCYYCRISRGDSNCCRTFGGVSGIHLPTLCLSCRSLKGCPWTLVLSWLRKPSVNPHPVVATEATYELLSCSEPTEESISELSFCAESDMVADFELSIHLVSSNVSGFGLPVLPVSVKESKLELPVCLNAVVESEFLYEISVSPDLSIVSDVEPCVCPILIY